MLEGLAALSMKTQHQSKFTLQMCPQVVFLVKVQSGEQDLANHVLHSNWIKQRHSLRKISKCDNPKRLHKKCL